jgi:hypothetical protein
MAQHNVHDRTTKKEISFFIRAPSPFLRVVAAFYSLKNEKDIF